MSEEKKEEKLPAEVGEYKGSTILTIFTGNNPNYKFSFGVSKAKAILNYLDDIKKFVEEHDKGDKDKK
jgi:hypothetical protein